jgi:hypothetical protein
MRARRFTVLILKIIAFGALALGSFAITRASLVYFEEDLAPFIIEKLPLPLENVWMGALKVHVVAASFCLPACLLLSSLFVMRRVPRFHRWLGRVTGTVLLLALVPTGLYMSLFAKGGLPSTIGFILTGGIVAFATVQGVRAARARRYIAHRRWMMHVLAQLSVAVTSRAMLWAFDAAAVDPNTAYLIALWLPVVGSFITAELLSARRSRNHEALDDLRPVALHPRDARRAGTGTGQRASRAA